jgi:hypothetical protein
MFSLDDELLLNRDTDSMRAFVALERRLQQLLKVTKGTSKVQLAISDEYLQTMAKYRERAFGEKSVESRWAYWMEFNFAERGLKKLRADIELIEKFGGKPLALALADWPGIDLYFLHSYYYARVLKHILESPRSPEPYSGSSAEKPNLNPRPNKRPRATEDSP